MAHAASPRSRRTLVVLALAAVLLASTAWSAGKVTGKFLGNGKEANLAHVVVVPHEPWADQTSYQIIFTEKDPAGAKKLESDAMFGRLGHALLVAVTETGDIFSTQVCHQALEKKNFSSSGTLFAENVKIENGQISGRFFTQGPDDFRGDITDIDLTFQAPLPAKK
jgi:hypothetical protein